MHAEVYLVEKGNDIEQRVTLKRINASQQRAAAISPADMETGRLDGDGRKGKRAQMSDEDNEMYEEIEVEIVKAPTVKKARVVGAP